MKRIRILAIVISALVILATPFCIQVSSMPPSPSFNYFLNELEFIEEALTKIGWSPASGDSGDYDLKSVLENSKLTENYLSQFESDREKADLRASVHKSYAFDDDLNNPLRIWISNGSYRVYSTGYDGLSTTGGLDEDDIWAGNPTKVMNYVHESYLTEWRKNNQMNLWSYLLRKL